MNTAKAIGIAVITLTVGVAAGWWLANHSAHDSTQEANGTPSSTSGRKVLYWYDPMVPSQHFDEPGRSPFMEMALVPKYADEAVRDAGVRVGGNVTQSLGIRVGKVEKTVLQPRLSAVGNVVFDEHAVQWVQARVSGYVTKLNVKAPLDRVHAGQVLAQITSPEWLQAEQEYAALLQSDPSRTGDLGKAARERLRVLDVPFAAIAEIERTGKVGTGTNVIAPIDGVVTELGVREGAAFMAGTMLFRINGLSTVWVNAQVPESQIYLIPTGATIAVHAAAWPGESFRGRVQALLPQVDASTRTFTVRAVLDNPEGKLSPGMFVSLDLSPQSGEPQLVVPSEAVIVTGQRSVVILAREAGAFAVAEVVAGPQVGDKTIILKGLSEGQSIVLSGQFLIDSEASLSSALSRLAATPSPAPQP